MRPNHWRRLAVGGGLIAFAGLLGLFVFLSLRPTPVISEVGWLPKTITGWADRHGNLRHLLAALVLTSAAHALCAWCRNGVSRNAFLVVSGGCGVFVVVLELLQAWQPGRVCDWRDIGWGLAGVGGAGIVWPALRGLFRAPAGCP